MTAHPSSARPRLADLGFDLGTVHTRVVVRGRGIALESPTVFASRGAEVVATGEEARKLTGRALDGTVVSRPLVDGLVFDADALGRFLRAIVPQGVSVRRRRILAAVSAALSDEERAAFVEVLTALGAADVSLVPASFAAATGAGMPVSDAVGSMVVDLGGGRTQAAVVALGGMVTHRSVPGGGNRLDEWIERFLRERHDLLVAERTPEALKIRIGTVTPELHGELRMRVRGRDQATGRPRELDLEAADIAAAIAEPVAGARAAVAETLRETPPELCADLVDRGILLTGGASQLRGLDQLLADDTGLPVFVAERPASCTALGVLALMDQPELVDRIERVG